MALVGRKVCLGKCTISRFPTTILRFVGMLFLTVMGCCRNWGMHEWIEKSNSRRCFCPSILLNNHYFIPPRCLDDSFRWSCAHTVTKRSAYLRSYHATVQQNAEKMQNSQSWNAREDRRGRRKMCYSLRNNIPVLRGKHYKTITIIFNWVINRIVNGNMEVWLGNCEQNEGSTGNEQNEHTHPTVFVISFLGGCCSFWRFQSATKVPRVLCTIALLLYYK